MAVAKVMASRHEDRVAWTKLGVGTGFAPLGRLGTRPPVVWRGKIKTRSLENRRPRHPANALEAHWTTVLLRHRIRLQRFEPSEVTLGL